MVVLDIKLHSKYRKAFQIENAETLMLLKCMSKEHSSCLVQDKYGEKALNI